jgi:hypothetical protein
MDKANTVKLISKYCISIISEELKDLIEEELE